MNKPNCAAVISKNYNIALFETRRKRKIAVLLMRVTSDRLSWRFLKEAFACGGVKEPSNYILS